MEPRPITWRDLNGDKEGLAVVTLNPPPHMDNCKSVQVLAGDGITMIPFTPNEIEVAQLAKGGTAWLILHTERIPPVALIVEAVGIIVEDL